MDYQKIYNNIIENARLENRNKGISEYYESHHIIPRCMGGNNNKSNLILLTAKEHFIAHRLLTLIYPDNNKLVRALWAMSMMKNNIQIRHIISSRTYENLKIEYARINSERIITDEFRNKISKARTGKTHTEETKKKISEITKERLSNPNIRAKFLIHCESKRGIPLSQQTKDKLSKSLKGRIVSIETKDRMKISNKINSINQKKPLKDIRSNIVYLKKPDLIKDLNISNREYLKLLKMNILIRIDNY